MMGQKEHKRTGRKQQEGHEGTKNITEHET